MLKTLFILVLVLVLRTVGTLKVRQSRRYTQRAGQCDRIVEMSVTRLIREARCRPVLQPTVVPVPQGYDSVSPAVVMVNRCQGLACHPGSFSCLPDLIANKSFPAYGHGGGVRNRKQACLEVTVEEHTECRCGCDKTCGKNQVLLEEQCECQCDQEQQRKCEVRQRLWDPSTCTCVCPSSLVKQCSSGEIFIPQLCRCEAN